MLTNDKKKALRSINKCARRVNDAILHDNLWKGRFYVAQKVIHCYSYEDGSGLKVHVLYEFIDLKTGKTALKWFEPCVMQLFKNRLFWSMNDFIVVGVDVWHNENPYDDKEVYRKDNSMPKYSSQNNWMGDSGVILADTGAAKSYVEI